MSLNSHRTEGIYEQNIGKFNFYRQLEIHWEPNQENKWNDDRK